MARIADKWSVRALWLLLFFAELAGSEVGSAAVRATHRLVLLVRYADCWPSKGIHGWTSWQYLPAHDATAGALAPSKAIVQSQRAELAAVHWDDWILGSNFGGIEDLQGVKRSRARLHGSCQRLSYLPQSTPGEWVLSLCMRSDLAFRRR